MWIVYPAPKAPSGGAGLAGARPDTVRRSAGVMHYTVLYYTILCYSILYYPINYYTILYLYYTILYYTILYYTILYYTILYYTIHASVCTTGIHYHVICVVRTCGYRHRLRGCAPCSRSAVVQEPR